MRFSMMFSGLLLGAMAALGPMGDTAVAGDGKGGKSCGCEPRRCSHHRHHHSFFHLENPPRRPVSPSLAAPTFQATPVLPLSSLRSFGRSTNSQLDPGVLRALAALSDSSSNNSPNNSPSADQGSKGSAAQTPTQRGASQDRGAKGSSYSARPLQSQGAQASSQLTQRMDTLTKQVNENTKKLDRLLTSLEAYLKEKKGEE